MSRQQMCSLIRIWAGLHRGLLTRAASPPPLCLPLAELFLLARKVDPCNQEYSGGPMIQWSIWGYTPKTSADSGLTLLAYPSYLLVTHYNCRVAILKPARWTLSSQLLVHQSIQLKSKHWNSSGKEQSCWTVTDTARHSTHTQILLSAFPNHFLWVSLQLLPLCMYQFTYSTLALLNFLGICPRTYHASFLWLTLTSWGQLIRSRIMYILYIYI